MRLGLVTYNIAADWDLDTLIHRCTSLGYEGVELRTTHAHGVEPALSGAERKDIRRRFEDSGVCLWGLGTVCEYDSVDRGEVRQNIETTREFVELARDVGARGVKVRPNRLHEKEGVPREKTLEQIGEAFRDCGRFAADHGVELWMEVHGKDTCRPENMRVILEVAAHENCNACWNSNLTDVDQNGSIRANFELLKSRVRSCHITELADTRYPWRDLFKSLADAGYDDRFTLAEIHASPDPDRLLTYYRRLWQELQPS